MRVNRIVNNGVEGFQIFDDGGNEYFIDVEKEELAVEKYNITKARELQRISNPSEPSYIELRLKEYPPIEEQLDMIYWDKINGTNNWVGTITAIKTKYPKPV